MGLLYTSQSRWFNISLLGSLRVLRGNHVRGDASKLSIISLVPMSLIKFMVSPPPLDKGGKGGKGEKGATRGNEGDLK